jgi:hypothetical protein
LIGGYRKLFSDAIFRADVSARGVVPASSSHEVTAEIESLILGEKG